MAYLWGSPGGDITLERDLQLACTLNWPAPSNTELGLPWGYIHGSLEAVQERQGCIDRRQALREGFSRPWRLNGRRWPARAANITIPHRRRATVD